MTRKLTATELALILKNDITLAKLALGETKNNSEQSEFSKLVETVIAFSEKSDTCSAVQ